MPSDTVPPSRALHLHPVSLLFTLGSAAWRLLLPAVLFVVFSRGEAVELWLAVLFGPAALHAVVRYLTFRYRFDPEDLVVRRGLVFRNERHIPYARIQSVDLVQNPLQRLLGVADVRVQTASGDEAEASFRVLSLAAVEAMRAHVSRGRVDATIPAASAPADAPVVPASPPPDGRVLATMPLREILLYGLISNRGMVVVAAAFGLYWQFALQGGRNGAPIDPSTIERLVGGLGTGFGPLVFVAGLLVLLAVVRLLSTAHAVATYHGFTLRSAGDDLRVSSGLLTKVAAMIPRHRIQTLTLRETPLHRLVQRVSVRVQTAGGHAGDREDIHKEDWLVPLIRRERVATLLREVEPEFDLETLLWRPIDPRARGRLFRRRSVFVLAATLGAVAAFGSAGLTALVLLVWAALSAHLDARSWSWALGSDVIAVRSGWWTRSVVIARFGKIQAIAVRETPLDRRAGHASIAVDTAGGPRGGGLGIPFLARGTAEAIRASLEAAVATTTFRW